MENILVNLKITDGESVQYQVVQIFSLDGSVQQYCAVREVSGEAVVFLRCYLTGEGNNTRVDLQDIPDDQEYARAAEYFLGMEKEELCDTASNGPVRDEDYISVTDGQGRTRDFIIHLIFEDEKNGQPYIAVQAVNEGKIEEEISLYRFSYENGKAAMDMISSDMEFERAKRLFMDQAVNPALKAEAF